MKENKTKKRVIQGDKTHYNTKQNINEQNNRTQGRVR